MYTYVCVHTHVYLYCLFFLCSCTRPMQAHRIHIGICRRLLASAPQLIYLKRRTIRNMYISLSISLSISISLSLYIYIHIHTYIQMYTHIYIYIYIYIHTYSLSLYVYIYIYIHIHMFIHSCSSF